MGNIDFIKSFRLNKYFNIDNKIGIVYEKQLNELKFNTYFKYWNLKLSSKNIKKDNIKFLYTISSNIHNNLKTDIFAIKDINIKSDKKQSNFSYGINLFLEF